MTVFATILTKASAALRWLALGAEETPTGTLLGRYERGSNSIRVLAASVLADLESAFPNFTPLAVTYDNSPTVTSSVSAPTITHESVTAAVSIKWREAERRGTALVRAAPYRFSGTLRLSFFSPRLAGDGAVRQCADFAADALRWDDDGEIHYETPSIVQGSPEIGSSGGDYARTVEIPFYLDEDNARLANSVGGTLGYEDIGEVCRTRFETFIGDSDGLIVVYDNAPAEIPTGTPWVRLDVLHGASEQVTQGVPAARFRHSGFMQASVYVDADFGDGAALEVADDIFDSFHSVADRGVTFKTPAVIASGRVGPYWRVIVQVPFHAETNQ